MAEIMFEPVYDDMGLGGMGWEHEIPDFRDYTPESREVNIILAQSRAMREARALTAAPTSVDLRPWCSPIEDQGQLGSCTANAGVGLLEYFERRAYGRHLDGSRLFLYKATRNLLGWTGDDGAYLRTTMKAMVLFGVPPEEYCRYNVLKFNDEPPAFLYAYAQSYRAAKYFRLDPPGGNPGEVVQRAKSTLAGNLPFMFGFTVYSSIPRVGAGTGDIPFPQPGERVVGGHAVVAVGYDDSKRIGSDTGAFIIRNSWGTAWGEGGYGYLPYSYFSRRVAVDLWSLVDSAFVNTQVFN